MLEIDYQKKFISFCSPCNPALKDMQTIISKWSAAEIIKSEY
jgi:hypothetical protein